MKIENTRYKYFKIGAPGDVTSCEERFMKKQMNTHEDKTDDDDYEGDDDDFENDLSSYFEKKIYQCDHPAMNGLGLLHVFGVPSLVSFSGFIARLALFLLLGII